MDSPSSSQMSCGSTGVELCASPTSQVSAAKQIREFRFLRRIVLRMACVLGTDQHCVAHNLTLRL